MATKEQILEILCGESGPANQAQLSEKLGEPISSFTTQLGRMVQQGLLEKNEQKEYTLTEEGRASALKAAEAAKIAGFTPLDETAAATEESLKTTEYQQFIEMGRITGVVPMALIAQVATHIWRGGDFRNLVWVWKGLTDMGIRSDLAQRWWHSWRSFLRQAVPEELAGVVSPPQTPAEKATAKGEAAGKGKRDYIIGPNDTPLYVGEGLGDLDYDDAVRISTVRAAALARGAPQGQPGQPATPGTMADDMAKIFNAVKEFIGPQSKGKSYIVKPGEEGYIVEEVEEGKPTVIATPGRGNTNPSPGFLIDPEGNLQELDPGRPVVIKQAAPASPPAKTFIVRQTAQGMVAEEFDAGKPIIINAPAPPSPGSSMPPMMPFPVIGSDGQPVYDSEGKPVYANIEPMMKWMGFQSEQRRADERHQSLMGLAQTVRENFGDGIQALKTAASESKGSSGAKTPPPSTPQAFKCGDCGTEFGAPVGWAGQPIKCPKCEREYTKEELLE